MTRVAAIDCGTNTIKLLVADLDPDEGTERPLVREMRMVRLGQDVDRTGRFSDEALARTFAAVEEYAALIEQHGAGVVRFCATSAARDAANGDTFVTGVRKRLGVAPEVVTGEEEAELSYSGATRGLVGSDLAAPFLVVDIGGGSTELILGDGHGHVRSAQSLDVGAVRLTERLLHGDPPSVDEVAATVAAVDEVLDGCRVPLAEAATVVGVAGTITTVTAGVLGLEEYDPTAIDQARIDVEDVHRTAEALLRMTRAERVALPYMHPGRADVIGAGAVILDRVLRRTDVEVLVVSEADILDGIAWSVA